MNLKNLLESSADALLESSDEEKNCVEYPLCFLDNNCFDSSLETSNRSLESQKFSEMLLPLSCHSSVAKATESELRRVAATGKASLEFRFAGKNISHGRRRRRIPTDGRTPMFPFLRKIGDGRAASNFQLRKKRRGSSMPSTPATRAAKKTESSYIKVFNAGKLRQNPMYSALI
eukprot:Selendium_serpulae@DN3705_c0_g1_i1.p2